MKKNNKPAAKRYMKTVGMVMASVMVLSSTTGQMVYAETAKDQKDTQDGEKKEEKITVYLNGQTGNDKKSGESPEEAVKSFKKVESIELVLKTLEQVLTENPIYKMGCDISDSAVEMAYNTIKIMEARMKIKQGFILRNVAGNNVVVPVGEATIDFNGMMSLNETGAFLFEKMIEGTTKEQLIEQLMSQYEIDADTAKNDVEEFIEKVKKENLFE